MEKKSILLTFDVEDWFQVENFKPYIKFSAWNSFGLRVEQNTNKILDLLDSYAFKPKATFFVLGWIAEKLPALVQEIHSRGHEVASHGFDHHLNSNIPEKDLIRDLARSKVYLEDLTCDTISGYRAPSFVINDRILEVISQAGYLYDTSYNSFSGHGRYGSIDLTHTTRVGTAYRISRDFYELPISNLNCCGKVIPLGGGGYFRLLPFSAFKLGMRNVLKNQDAFVFYAHPWEFDPDQPRVHEASKWFKFRHYINLRRTEAKLRSLISAFSDCQFITCKQYIDNLS